MSGLGEGVVGVGVVRLMKPSKRSRRLAEHTSLPLRRLCLLPILSFVLRSVSHRLELAPPAVPRRLPSSDWARRIPPRRSLGLTGASTGRLCSCGGNPFGTRRTPPAATAYAVLQSTSSARACCSSPSHHTLRTHRSTFFRPLCPVTTLQCFAFPHHSVHNVLSHTICSLFHTTVHCASLVL